MASEKDAKKDGGEWKRFNLMLSQEDRAAATIIMKRMGMRRLSDAVRVAIREYAALIESRGEEGSG